MSAMRKRKKNMRVRTKKRLSKLKAIKEAANTYLESKIADIGNEENATKYQKKRINTVKVIRDFADKSLEIQAEEKRT